VARLQVNSFEPPRFAAPARADAVAGDPSGGPPWCAIPVAGAATRSSTIGISATTVPDVDSRARHHLARACATSTKTVEIAEAAPAAASGAPGPNMRLPIRLHEPRQTRIQEQRLAQLAHGRRHGSVWRRERPRPPAERARSVQRRGCRHAGDLLPLYPVPPGSPTRGCHAQKLRVPSMGSSTQRKPEVPGTTPYLRRGSHHRGTAAAATNALLLRLASAT